MELPNLFYFAETFKRGSFIVGCTINKFLEEDSIFIKYRVLFLLAQRKMYSDMGMHQLYFSKRQQQKAEEQSGNLAYQIKYPEKQIKETYRK